MFPGGSWYAVDGWLTWALASLGQRDYAFSELLRNTLAAHATACPAHWDGIISVDDVCYAYYSAIPEVCGAGLTTGYEGQIMHQPAWSLFDTIRLAGITPIEKALRSARSCRCGRSRSAFPTPPSRMVERPPTDTW